MAKEFKSTNELIEILNSKGVSIKDENNVRFLIEKYSYYSIVNSYKWIFKIGDNYKGNASFEEIFAMYKFDKNLKIIMLKYILEIEAVIKTKIANLFAEKYGLEDYLDINNFDLKDDDSNLEHIERLIEEICLNILLKERPFAKDLKEVTGVLKLVSDIERLGDHAKDIFEFSQKLRNFKNEKKDNLGTLHE